MASNEKDNYLLKFNQFESHIRTTWQQLQIDDDFYDVILACDDKQFLSHKVIISSSSPVFKNILKQNPNHLQVIYLDGVKYNQLQSLINYMYQGEVNIAEEDLGEFLQVAQDLKIKGLLQVIVKDFNAKYSKKEHPENIEQEKLNTENLENLFNNIDVFKQRSPVYNFQRDDLIEQEHISKIHKMRRDNDKTKDSPTLKSNEQFDCDKCHKQYNKEKILKRHKSRVHEGIRYPCNFCDKSSFTDTSGLKRHIKSVHEGVRYSCNKCDTSTFTDLSGLKRHKASIHEGITFSCDQCDISPFTDLSGLKKHRASIHDGFRYACDQCDASSFSNSSNLKTHKASVHEGMKYLCDQCDISTFTDLSGLKRHIASVHEGVRYPCDLCDTKSFIDLTGLKRHKNSTHKGVRYPCDQCDVSSFTQESNLRLHKASVHKGIHYQCEKCDFKAKQKSNLSRHTKIAHNC